MVIRPQYLRQYRPIVIGANVMSILVRYFVRWPKLRTKPWAIYKIFRPTRGLPAKLPCRCR